MSSIEIMIMCAVLAYLFTKIREYTKATKEIKKGLESGKEKEKVIGSYRDQQNKLQIEIYKLQDEKAQLEIQPKTHKIKRKIHKLDKQIADLTKDYEKYGSALKDYQSITESKSKDEVIKNLRSYLNNKHHY